MFRRTKFLACLAFASALAVAPFSFADCELDIKLSHPVPPATRIAYTATWNGNNVGFTTGQGDTLTILGVVFTYDADDCCYHYTDPTSGNKFALQFRSDGTVIKTDYSPNGTIIAVNSGTYVLGSV